VADDEAHRRSPHPPPRPMPQGLRRLAHRVRDAGRVVRGKTTPLPETHYFLWEFESAA
jgi:hypothetical protein